MKCQDLFSLKKKIECRLLQILLGALRVNIAAIAREKNELRGLTDRLDKTTKVCEIEIEPEKTKVMTSNYLMIKN